MVLEYLNILFFYIYTLIFFFKAYVYMHELQNTGPSGVLFSGFVFRVSSILHNAGEAFAYIIFCTYSLSLHLAADTAE